MDSSNPFRIGASGGTAKLTQLFDGSIDEVAIYRIALSPAEIQQRYQRGNAGITSVGTDIQVEPVDATTEASPVELTFAQVNQAGVSTLSTNPNGPAVPSGLQMGTPPTYYELTTTAGFFGPVRVCINYTEGEFVDESESRLYQFEGGDWTDATDTGYPNIEGDLVCGTVDSLSTFALFESEQ